MDSLLSWHGSLFWVYITTFRKVRHSDSVKMTKQIYHDMEDIFWEFFASPQQHIDEMMRRTSQEQPSQIQKLCIEWLSQFEWSEIGI